MSTMTICVLNYAHPITPQASAQIASYFSNRGSASVLVKDIPVQLDFEADLLPQLNALVQAGQQAYLEVVKDRYNNAHQYTELVINPPSLAIAAGYIAVRFSSDSDAMLPAPPLMLWWKRDPAAIPPTFILGGIL